MSSRKQHQSLLKDFTKIFYHTSQALKALGKKEEKFDKLDQLDKSILKELESIKKISLKNKSNLGKEPMEPQRSKEGGFSKKTEISSELREFLGVSDPDKKFSPVEITRAICIYIHYDPEKMNKPEYDEWKHLNNGSRNLQDPTKKTRILPDEKLYELLKVKEYAERVARKEELYRKGKDIVPDADIYYWTIQRLLKPHFIKNTQPKEEVRELERNVDLSTPAPVKSYRSKRDSYSTRRTGA